VRLLSGGPRHPEPYFVRDTVIDVCPHAFPDSYPSSCPVTHTNDRDERQLQ